MPASSLRPLQLPPDSGFPHPHCQGVPPAPAHCHLRSCPTAFPHPFPGHFPSEFPVLTSSGGRFPLSPLTRRDSPCPPAPCPVTALPAPASPHTWPGASEGWASVTAWELPPGPTGTLTIAPTDAQLATQRSGQATAGSLAARGPPPAQLSSRHFPFPWNLRSGPGGPGRMPLPDPAQRSLSLTRRSVLVLRRAPDTHSGVWNPSRTEKVTSGHFRHYLQPLQPPGQSPVPAPQATDTPIDDTPRPMATQGPPTEGHLSQVTAHTSLCDSADARTEATVKRGALGPGPAQPTGP